MTDADLALRQLDTLRSQCEASGWTHCSRAHLETVEALAHLQRDDWHNAQKHAYAALGESQGEGDFRWRLVAYQVLCETFGKTENFALLGKYATLMGKEANNHMYYAMAYIYRARVAAHDGNYRHALTMHDSVMSYMRDYAKRGSRERFEALLIYYATMSDKTRIYRHEGRWEDAYQCSMEMLATLDEEESKGYDYMDRNGYKIERLDLYLRLANICMALGRDGSEWFDKAMAIYPDLTHSATQVMDVADYLYANKRYADYERLVLPYLHKQLGKRPTERVLRMAWQWAGVLVAMGRRADAEQWIATGMEVSRHHAYDIRSNAESEFMLANESELKDQKLKTQEAERNAWRLGLLLAIMMAAAAMVGLVHVRRKKKEIERLYALAEETHRKEQSAERQMRAAVQAQTSPVEATPDEDYQMDMMLLAKLHDYLTENDVYRRCDLSMEDIAQQLGVRQKRLNAMLQSLKGTTLVGYVRDKRMDYACKLLREQPQMKVETVATQSGYNTARQFMRAFKDKYNLTPSEYRQASLGRNMSQEELGEE